MHLLSISNLGDNYLSYHLRILGRLIDCSCSHGNGRTVASHLFLTIDGALYAYRLDPLLDLFFLFLLLLTLLLLLCFTLTGAPYLGIEPKLAPCRVALLIAVLLQRLTEVVV